jgi:hypothetical protein
MTLIDHSGWSKYAISADDREIFVSLAGSDANAGSSPAAAVRTISRAKSLLRNESGDHLCLRSGDPFPEGLGRWTLSGASASRPIVVRTYGGMARAHLFTRDLDALYAIPGGGQPQSFKHVVFMGLDFDAAGRTLDAAGVRFLTACEDILFEDCLWSGYSNGVILDGYAGRLHDVRLRRCVVLDSTHPTGHTQGIYASRIDNLHLYECILDNNGAPADIFRHGIYVQSDAGQIVMDGCAITRSSSHALQARSGGVITGNLSVQNPIAFQFGGGDDPTPGGIQIVARGNVALEGCDINTTTPRGWFMFVANVKTGRINSNYAADNRGGSPSGLHLAGDEGKALGAVGIHDLGLADNASYGWGVGLEKTGDITNLVEQGNHLEDGARFVDPTVSISAYLASIGLAGYTTDDWISAMRSQSRASWNKRIMPLGGLNRFVAGGLTVV